MVENLIFLDFDGVINNNTEDLILSCVMLLRHIIKRNKAKVVVISSNIGNATNNRKNKIITFLNKLGIYDIDFIDPNFKGMFYNKELSRRTLGIIDYLKKHPYIKYLIIDDEFDYEYRMLKLNHLKTEMWEGLKYEDYSKVKFESVELENLKGVNYKYRELIGYEKATNDLIRVLKLIKK